MGKPEVRQPSVVVASWKNQSWATTQPLGSGSVETHPALTNRAQSRMTFKLRNPSHRFPISLNRVLYASLHRFIASMLAVRRQKTVGFIVRMPCGGDRSA